MKLSLLTLILGFAVILFGDSLPSWAPYALLFLVTFLFTFLSFLPKLKAEKDASSRTGTFINVVLIAAILEVAVLFAFYYFSVPSYLYPVAAALIIFLRHPFRMIVKATIKEPKGYGVRSETDRGEVVASKAEKKVADWFYHHKIPYVYEEQIEFPDGERIKYDFYLPDDDIYVEYWGLASASGEVGERYRARKKEKIEVYKKYGLRLLSIGPGDLDDLDKVIPSRIKKLTGRGLSGWFINMMFGRKHVHSSKIVKQVGKDKEDETTDVVAGTATEAEGVEKIFCPHCGHEMEGEAIFCDDCGKSVEE